MQLRQPNKRRFTQNQGRYSVKRHIPHCQVLNREPIGEIFFQFVRKSPDFLSDSYQRIKGMVINCKKRIKNHMFNMTPTQTYREDVLAESLDSVFLFVEMHELDLPHAMHVTELAMSLFDQLQPLHQFDDQDRFLLECAAMLHDVGKAIESKDHHKHSQNLIMQSSQLQLNDEQRDVIGLIARFHRGKRPGFTTKSISHLEQTDKDRVLKLSAILRLADSLDKMHKGIIDHVEVMMMQDEVLIYANTHHPKQASKIYPKLKTKLFSKIFGYDCDVEFCDLSNRRKNLHIKNA